MNRKRANGEGSIYWVEAVQRWRGAISTPSGRRTVSGNTRKEVAAKLKALGDDAERAAPITVGELAERWFQDQLRVEDGEASTRSQVWARVDKHIVNDRLGRTRLDALTVLEVEAWLDTKMVHGHTVTGERRVYSREYMNKIRQDLKQMLDWAVTRRLVDYNAVVGTRLRKGTPRQPKRTLTQEQAEALLTACATTPYRYGPYVILCLLTGMRPGEAAGLSWRDIDFAGGEIHVRHALQRATGGRPIGIGPANKGGDARTLRMWPLVADALHRERKLQREMRLAAGPLWSKDWDGVVFLGPLGEPPWASNMRRSMRLIATEAGAGIPDDLDLYELRHSCASLLDAAGVAVHDIIDQLGHRDTRMFYKHYRHRVNRVVETSWR